MNHDPATAARPRLYEIAARVTPDDDIVTYAESAYSAEDAVFQFRLRHGPAAVVEDIYPWRGR